MSDKLYINHIVDQDDAEKKYFFEDSQARDTASNLSDALTVVQNRITSLENDQHIHDNKLVIDQLEEGDIAILKSINEDRINSWDNKLSEFVILDNSITENKIEDKAVSLNKLGEDVTASFTEINSELDEINTKIETIVGEDTNSTIRSIASEEVAKIVANAPDSFDTLQEIAGWIQSDTTGAAKMAKDIDDLNTTSSKNAEDIDKLQLEDNILVSVTDPIGNLTRKTYNCSIKNLLIEMLCKIINGSASLTNTGVTLKYTGSYNDTLSGSNKKDFTNSTSSISAEIGTTVKITSFSTTYSGTFSSGGGSFLDIDGNVVTPTLSWTNASVPQAKNVKIDKIGAVETFNCQSSYIVKNGDSIYMGTNLNDFVGGEENKISINTSLGNSSTGTKTSQNLTISGYRCMFYGASDEILTSSDDLRSLTIKQVKTGESEKFNIPDGKKYLLVAVPKGYKVTGMMYYSQTADSNQPFVTHSSNVYIKGAENYAVTTTNGNDTTDGYTYNLYYIYFSQGASSVPQYSFTVATE